MRRFLLCSAVAIAALPVVAAEYLNGIKWQQPPVVDPGETDASPPSDAIVLFDGSDLSKWKNSENWSVEDGAAVTGKGQIVSKQEFGDCQIHLEWSAPKPPKGSGQGRGNSGLFLMGKYEIQILDSYNNETYHDGQWSDLQANATDGQCDAPAGRVEHVRHPVDRPAFQRGRFFEIAGLHHRFSQRRGDPEPL